MRFTATILLFSASACSDYKFATKSDLVGHGDDTANLSDDDTGTSSTTCPELSIEAVEVGITDACPSAPEGGFDPIVEWTSLPGKSCKALPAVGDLDGDGIPEIVVSATDPLSFLGTAELYVLDGSTGMTKWSVDAQMGYASTVALGDVNSDGEPELVTVKEYEHSLTTEGSYSVVLYDRTGAVIWESDRFVGDDFDYTSAPIISDMDHDGSPEIVVGRVIFNADGTTRGQGVAGRGSFGHMPWIGGGTISEGALSAVSDLDLDGVEEVITGNAIYSPDGAPLWVDFTQDDGMVSVANLDDDEFGEFVAVSHNSVRAMDTSGLTLWGPLIIADANITSPAAIGDIDADGYPEIVVAGGSEIWALERDGTLLWSETVHDESGATGASLFDFEGDGIPEVVYIDEQQMIAYDGATGAVKFLSTEHASPTMYDYPVIADVDSDDQAEIVVCHSGFATAVSVYGDASESWAPARKVWNQHAYSITNVNDDLTIPVEAIPNFTLYNNWHAGVDRGAGEALLDDVFGEIVDVCTDDCGLNKVRVTYRIANTSAAPLYTSLPVAFYADFSDGDVLVAAQSVGLDLEAGWSTEGLQIWIDAEDLEGSEGIRLRADDNGTGTGILSECSEIDNADHTDGPFCD